MKTLTLSAIALSLFASLAHARDADTPPRDDLRAAAAEVAQPQSADQDNGASLHERKTGGNR